MGSLAADRWMRGPVRVTTATDIRTTTTVLRAETRWAAARAIARDRVASAATAGGSNDLDAGERVRDVLNDHVLVH
jgi:hypothetical protein